MLIVALDPGGTTGWASFHTPNNRDGYKSGESPGFSVWGLLESTRLSYTRIDWLVMESFQLRHIPHVDLTPVEVIGVIKEWARQHGTPLTPQLPGLVIPNKRKQAYWTDDRLKEYSVYKRGKPHANDAMRHLLYFINFGKGKEVIANSGLSR